MIGIILAHGKAQKIFDLHLENWKAAFDSICVICPIDDIIQYPGYIHMVGLSEHNGYWTCERMRYACELAAAYPSACIVEYDTLVFDLPDPDITLKGCGPMFDHKPEYTSTWYIHSPWITSRENFRSLSKCKVDPDRDRFCDRWLAEAAVSLDIWPNKLASYYTPPCGYIRDSNEWKNAVIAAHSENLGAIHGIKDELLSKTISAVHRI